MKRILLAMLSLLPLAYGNAQITLFNQTSSSTNAYIESCVMTDINKYATAADDFTIPSGEGWFITQIDLQGNSAVDYTYPDSALVQIFDDNAGYPGNVIYEENLTFSNCIFVGLIAFPTITVPNWALSPGTYWLSISGYTLSSNTWRWNLLSSGSGNENVLIDPDGYFGSALTDWTKFSDEGLGAYQGINFKLTGNKSLASIAGQETAAVNIYPNPVGSNCTIRLAQEVTSFDLLDVHGRLVMTVVRNSSGQYDFSSLETGIYFLSWIENGQPKTKKLVKT